MGEDCNKEYREANRKVKIAIRNAKNDWIEKQAKDIDEGMRYNDTKKAFNTVKTLNREQNYCKAQIIEDKNGCTLTKTDNIAERWKEYCSELYQFEATGKDPGVLDDMTYVERDETHKIFRNEIEEAIKTLKSYKAPGSDNITSELLQEEGQAMVDILQLLCNKILQRGELPTQWTESILIPIPKKKACKKCSEYRTMSLISHATRFF